MKILVTGASGTVGSAAIALLVKQGKHEITAFDIHNRKSRKILHQYRDKISIVYGDIGDKYDLEKACVDQDIVIHLAAIIPPLADDKPELAARVNVQGTANLLTLLKKYSPRAFFIYGSSISVYGDRLQNPYIKVGDPLVASLGDEYAKTKIKAEKLVQHSGLDYTIFRITAVMGANNHKISKIIFHMPLATPIELVVPADAGRALVNAITHKTQLNGRIFNLSGGKDCTIIYRDLLIRSFKNTGLGQFNLPENSFATGNFHCGYYADGDDLEDILHFRQETLADFFRHQKNGVKLLTKIITTIFRGPIKKSLLLKSEPLAALRNNDKEMINRFFGQ
jgi:nucleoside-diphosphate-sugar epimerase